MTNQNKMIIGGVVVAALLGYWWYTKKQASKSLGALPKGGGTTVPGPGLPAQPGQPAQVATTMAAQAPMYNPAPAPPPY